MAAHGANLPYTTDKLCFPAGEGLIGRAVAVGGAGGGGWVPAVIGRSGNRQGIAAALNPVFYNQFGAVITDAVGIAAAGGGLGSRCDRLSWTVNGMGSKSVPECPIAADIARPAGLLCNLVFDQTVDVSNAAARAHKSQLKAYFPYTTTDVAEEVSLKLALNTTVEGGYTELFFRMLLLAMDTHSGCGGLHRQIGGVGVPANAIVQNMVRNFWPNGLDAAGAVDATVWDNMFLALTLRQRVYYISGFRGNRRLSESIVNVLWHITAAYNGFAGNVRAAGRCYSRHESLSEPVRIYLHGPRTARTDGGTSANANQIAARPTAQDAINCAMWLLDVTGDMEGFSTAIEIIAESIPFHPLKQMCTRSDLATRTNGLAPPAALILRIDYVVAAIGSKLNANTDNAALRAAHNAAFGVDNDQLTMRNPAVAVGDVFTDAFNLMDYADEVKRLLWIRYNYYADGTNEFLNQLTLYEYARLSAAFLNGRLVPVRASDNRGNNPVEEHWDGLQPAADVASIDLSNRGTAAHLNGLPAVGAYTSRAVAVTNGVSEMIDALQNPARTGAPPREYDAFREADADEVITSLHVISAMMRCLADEVARTSGRCDGTEALVVGAEPGNAGNWNQDDFRHVSEVYMNHSLPELTNELAIVRGARVALWPNLRHTAISSEVCVPWTTEAVGTWELNIALTPLQMQALIGLPSGFGGMYKNNTVLDYLGRMGSNWLNSSPPDTDLSRVNKLHMVCAVASTTGSCVSLAYSVLYTERDYGAPQTYRMDVGPVRRVRHEFTNYAGEVLTDLAWKQILAQEPMVIAGIVDETYHAIASSAPRSVGIWQANWNLGGARDEINIPHVSMTMRNISVKPYLQQVRDQTNKNRILAANANVNLSVSVLGGILQEGTRLSKSIEFYGSMLVGKQWCRPMVGAIAQPVREMFTNEEGANRFMRQIGARMGVDNVEEMTINAQQQGRQQQQQQFMRIENAPGAAQEQQLTAMQAQITQLQELLAAANLNNQNAQPVVDGAVQVPAANVNNAPVVAPVQPQVRIDENVEVVEVVDQQGRQEGEQGGN
jgi:hypothetical protein